jgi:hypothetical protein
MVCGTLVHRIDHPWWFATRIGLVTGVVTGLRMTLSPNIEHYRTLC